MTRRTIRLTVNGRPVEGAVEPRRSLADFLREGLDLTGTHLGCEHGVCGACTVLLAGEPVRSCLLFAVQMDGASLTTVEGLAPGGGGLHPVQEAFWDAHALQCGFCTPGMLLTAVALLRRNPDPSEAEIRVELSGNLCMCTGYVNIVRAVRLAAQRLAAAGRSGGSEFPVLGSQFGRTNAGGTGGGTKGRAWLPRRSGGAREGPGE